MTHHVEGGTLRTRICHAALPQIKTIVVIGGTGHFGGRICRRLLGEPNTRLVVTSRSKKKAQRLVAELRCGDARHDIKASALDHSSLDFEADLRALNPDLVIHTAGPYQGQDYRVARACIDCHAHYIDLADGREFVEGFNQLNSEAQNSGVLLVSGASTLPGLSSAVIDSMSGQFNVISGIEISIAPAHQTPRGPGTIAAVMSYCGKPFKVLEQGRWMTRYGWQDLRIQNYPALGKRLSGACDVPDLSLMPNYVKGCETVTFHAALEAWWEQMALWMMGWLARAGMVRNWGKLTPLFHRMSLPLKNLGSDKGGMHIRLSGLDSNNNPAQRVWYLTAENNHGPEIPCTPALVLARKLVRGQLSIRGAVPCLGLMTLSDFADEMTGFDISWEFHD